MYVYILETTNLIPTKHYVGITKSLKQRLQYHNEGKRKYTSAYRPWTYKHFVWFGDPAKTFAFERYLKSGSGRGFAKAHF